MDKLRFFFSFLNFPYRRGPIVNHTDSKFRVPSSGLLFTTMSSATFLGIICFVVGRVSPPPALIPNSMRIKIPRCALLKISAVYALSGILITLSLDQNRVLCHLQDPIKGITLVFSLVYYFFFCRKSKPCNFIVQTLSTECTNRIGTPIYNNFRFRVIIFAAILFLVLRPKQIV